MMIGKSIFIKVAIACSLLMVQLISSGCGREKTATLAGSLAGRNVIVIVADAMNGDHLSSYGYHRETTPFIDTMAEKGLKFAHAYSQTSWTVPSVVSIFTSQVQERHGIIKLNQELDDDLSTLAELFKQQGYRTAFLCQNYILRLVKGMERGFEAYEFYKLGFPGVKECLARARQIIYHQSDAPVFLYLHLLPPHQPYMPPDDFQNRFDVEYQGYVDGSVESMDRLMSSGDGPDDPDVIHMAALYDEYICWVDEEIKRLLVDLLASDRADEYLFIITSDHGEAFMQHGTMGHNAHVHEEMIRVPMIFLAPGSAIKGGTVIDAPVVLLDLLPTLAGLFNLDVPRQKVNGNSLVSLMEVPERVLERPLFFSSRYRPDPKELQIGVRSGRFKLIRDYRNDIISLFDLETDPAEKRNLYSAKPGVAKQLEKALKGWFLQATMERKNEVLDDNGTLPEDVRKALKAIGY